MTDSTALRDAIGKAGLKYKFVAQQLGLTPYGLAKKIDNKSDFKASEIAALSNILALSERERTHIFFKEIVN